LGRWRMASTLRRTIWTSSRASAVSRTATELRADKRPMKRQPGSPLMLAPDGPSRKIRRRRATCEQRDGLYRALHTHNDTNDRTNNLRHALVLRCARGRSLTAYVRIRQHTSDFVSIRQHVDMLTYVGGWRRQ